MVKQKAQKPLTVVLALLISVSFVFPLQSRAELGTTSDSTTSNTSTSIDTLTVEQLNNAIAEKQNQQKALDAQLQQYQDLLAQQQKASASLQNELTLLQTQLEKSQLDLQSLDFSIEEKRLQVESSKRAIADKQTVIDTQRSYLEDLVRTINRYDQKDPLELLVTHDSFSEIVSDIRATTTMEQSVTNALAELQQAKANLEREQADQERRKRELEGLQQQVQQTSQLLVDQQNYKQQILTDTRSSETQYSNLLQQAKQDQVNADSDIRSLQQKVDEKLNGGGSNTNSALSIFTGNRNVQLAWPVAPLKGISAYFHDPTYPFRKYFEHPAIDIPALQGTPIAAPDDGYVARTHNGGMDYSYIMLVHSNSITTVYGHVSQINVAEDTYVKKGQIIGKSGGMPGTPGAGMLTTGAHLHFEVRMNGIPVNPLDYLP